MSQFVKSSTVSVQFSLVTSLCMRLKAVCYPNWVDRLPAQKCHTKDKLPASGLGGFLTTAVNGPVFKLNPLSSIIAASLEFCCHLITIW